MTPTERLAYIEQVGERERERQRRKDAILSPVGGPTCRTCKFWDGYEGHMAQCRNPVVRADGRKDWIENDRLRSQSGICGPEGLLHQTKIIASPTSWFRRLMGGIGA